MREIPGREKNKLNWRNMKERNYFSCCYQFASPQRCHRNIITTIPGPSVPPFDAV